MDIPFNRYYSYHELASFLEGLAAERPGLARSARSGKRYEGLDILAPLTGHRYRSVMEFSGGRFLFGDYQDWAYEHLGTLAYCTELWDWAGRAEVARARLELPGRGGLG